MPHQQKPLSSAEHARMDELTNKAQRKPLTERESSRLTALRTRWNNYGDQMPPVLREVFRF